MCFGCAHRVAIPLLWTYFIYTKWSGKVPPLYCIFNHVHFFITTQLLLSHSHLVEPNTSLWQANSCLVWTKYSKPTTVYHQSSWQNVELEKNCFDFFRRVYYNVCYVGCGLTVPKLIYCIQGICLIFSPTEWTSQFSFAKNWIQFTTKLVIIVVQKKRKLISFIRAKYALFSNSL